MKRARFKPIGLLLLLMLAGVSRAEAQMPSVGPGSPWVLAPAFYPRGALITLVSGDPNAAAPFEVRLAFPKGYRVSPHFHSATLHIQVLEGSLKAGVGDRMDLKKVQTLSAGDTASVPANAHYYYTAPEVTILSIKTTGPFTLVYVDPTNHPNSRPGFPR
jgi:quercetin dioxygenase-like cupin family protein